MIGRLLDALYAARLDDLTGEEIADLLWLAVHQTRGIRAPLPSGLTAGTPPEPPLGRSEKPPSRESPSQRQEPSSDLFLPDTTIDRESEGNKHTVGGIGFPTPGVPALPNRLAIGRSLRDLSRRVPSPVITVFDEAATVQRIAEERTWFPINRPAPERWLDLALVVEESPSMVIWRQTIDELQNLLEHQGAFRMVTRWGLRINHTPSDAGMAQPIFYAGSRYNDFGQPPIRSPQELVDPYNRRLILLVSDCVAPGWHDGRMELFLRVWAETGLVSLVQVLPEDLWPRTGLAQGIQVDVRAPTPGAPNHQLQRRYRWHTGNDSLPAGMLLPVTTLEPDRLSLWARSLTARGRSWSPGLLIPYSIDDRPQPVGTREVSEPATPEERVERLFQEVSPAARRLIGYLAVVPLSLPVMRLVQETMMAEVQQVHLAEIFLSGLVVRQSGQPEGLHPDEVLYDFLPGVREVLLTTLLDSEIDEVMERNSYFVDRNSGQPIRFSALLEDPTQVGQIHVDTKSRTFAHISVEVLRFMGGVYAELAEWLSGVIQTDWMHEQEKEHSYLFHRLQDASELIPGFNEEDLWLTTLTLCTADYGASFDRAMLFLAEEGGTRLRGHMGIGHLQYKEAQADWEEYVRVGTNWERFLDALQANAIQPTPLYEVVRDYVFAVGNNDAFAQVLRQNKTLTLSKAEAQEYLPADFVARFGVTDYCLVPVNASDQMLGVVVLDNFWEKDPNRVGVRGIRDNLINQAALLVENLRKSVALEDLIAVQYELLTQATARPLKDTLLSIGQSIQSIAGADLVAIYPVQDNEIELHYDHEHAVSIGRHHPSNQHASPVPTTLSKYLLQETKQPLFSENVLADQNLFFGRKRSEAPMIEKEGIRSAIATPIFGLRTGKPRGILYVGYRTPHQFTDVDRRMVASFALLIATAIGNWRDAQGLRDTQDARDEELRKLSEVLKGASEVAQNEDLDTAEKIVIESLLDVVPSLFGWTPVTAGITLKRWERRQSDQEPMEIHDYFYAPESGIQNRRVLRKNDKGINNRAMASNTIQNVWDVRKDPDYRPRVEGSNTLSELDVPILLDGQVFGVFNIESPLLAAFTPHHEEIARRLADIAALAIGKVRRQRSLSAPISILYLAANPSDTTRLQLHKEYSEIRESLQKAGQHERFTLTTELAVRVGELIQLLVQHKPVIVYFSGHGSEDGEILLEDEIGNSFPLPQESVQRIFGVLNRNGNQIRCVILNACFTERQARYIAEHVDIVVGIASEIDDRAAIKFASIFYASLGEGDSVQRAFELACANIDLHGLHFHDALRLITKEGVDSSSYYLV